MTLSFLRVIILAAAILSVGRGPAPLVAEDASDLSLEELRAQRRELAQRPRRIIMNNDGCDVLYYPKTEKPTVEGFLAKRTTPLAGSQVGAIAFCPTSSGFSNFTHETKVGTVLARSGYEFGIKPDSRNIAQDLIDQGTDCLRAVVQFGHEHDMEVFWSMRMNDTHDVAHRADKPYFLFPPLKIEHPEWLVGNPDDRTPHGRWSSVDYARPEIRDLAFRYIEEVCANYDIDGVELDFFRHLCYFKSTAMGGKASDEERTLMTDLMRRVRKMTEKSGLERGQPILVAVRVPDSADYCRDMGFDIETWLRDGLVDILITTGYFRLNPWQYSVDLGHKYDVQVYPCLSDSRVRGETRFHRSSLESYRGRAMNVWKAGADGLHLFNYFNPNAALWNELGDPESLLTKDKLYFVHVRDGDPRSYLASGRNHRTVILLGPSHGRQATVVQPILVDLTVGDDVGSAKAQAARPSVTLHIETPTVTSAAQLETAINGTKLAGGTLIDGWVDYVVPLSAVRCGKNRIEIAARPSTATDDPWNIVFDGGAKPGRDWNRDRGSERTVEEPGDESLRIADRGEESGDYLYYRRPWGADTNGQAVIEAELKVESGSSFVIFANGVSGERLGFWPDRIELFHNRQMKYAMDTTDDFHAYRLELDGADLKVFVDGRLRIDAPNVLAARSGYGRSEVAFGAANSPMMGEAHWKSVRAQATGVVCQDLVLSVSYTHE